MNKETARREFSEKRSLLSDDKIKTFSNQIFFHWKNSYFSSFNSYHIFLTISDKKEIDTLPIIEQLWSMNKKIYCSKVQHNTLLHFELTPETELKKSSWGIPEPCNQKNIILTDIDCIFIPLLAYDIFGNRVGYGKGFYDHFLQNHLLSKKVGLSLFNPVNQIDDISISDIPLDHIITPNYSSDFPMEVK